MGLPYAFASHFAPRLLKPAMQIYRNNFKPSKQLEKPYALACVNAVAAPTTEEAEFLALSVYQVFAGILTNTRQPVSPPNPDAFNFWTSELKDALAGMTACTFVGDKATLSEQFQSFIEGYELDEIMISGNIFDQQKRIQSYEILSEVFKGF